MNKKPNLWERFKAETPKFEKIAQLLSLVLAVIIAHINPATPAEAAALDYLTGASVAVALFAQFATKVETTVDSVIADPSLLLTLGPQLLEHMGDIKASLQVVASPPASVVLQENEKVNEPAPPVTGVVIPKVDQLNQK